MNATAFSVAAGFAGLYLWFCARAPSPARTLIKTTAVVALAAAAWNGPHLLVIALIFCAAGDWCLSRPGERAFMAGVGAFALGHLTYAALFLTRPDADVARLFTLPETAWAAPLILLGVWMARVLAPRAGVLKPAVLGYIPVILFMGLASLTLPPVEGLGLHPAALAAALFILSDVVLAFETFVWPERHVARRIAPYVVWPLYWLSQAGMVLAMAGAGQNPLF